MFSKWHLVSQLIHMLKVFFIINDKYFQNDTSYVGRKSVSVSDVYKVRFCICVVNHLNVTIPKGFLQSCQSRIQCLVSSPLNGSHSTSSKLHHLDGIACLWPLPSETTLSRWRCWDGHAVLPSSPCCAILRNTFTWSHIEVIIKGFCLYQF